MISFTVYSNEVATTPPRMKNKDGTGEGEQQSHPTTEQQSHPPPAGVDAEKQQSHLSPPRVDV